MLPIKSFLGKNKRGAKKFFAKTRSNGLKIAVFTIRPKEKILSWLKKHDFPFPDLITNVKIPAFVYIDDRGLKFNGCFNELLNEVKSYKTYWE